MSDLDRQNAINDAVAILSCIQSLLCEARKDVTVEADGLYMLLACVIDRLQYSPQVRKT